MTTDRYTKAVLTVIAVSLAAIAIENAVPNAFAQRGVQKVVICDSVFSEGTCASVVGNSLRVVN